MQHFWPQHRRALLLALATSILIAAAVAGGLVFAGGDREAAPTEPSVPRTRARLDRPPGLKTVLVRPQAWPSRPVRPGVMPKAGNAVGGGDGPDYVSGQLLVKFADGTSAAEARRVLERVNGDVDARVGELGVTVVDVPAGRTAQALAAVDASPSVEYVERDVAVGKFDTVPNDSLWRNQWGPLLVKSPKAWDASTGSADVIVAVLDTGVDPSHPDLAGSYVPGYDVINGDADPRDEDGHGTAAAGVIAARTNNTQGQAGICWRCSIMPVQVLDAKGSGTTSEVAAGIIWAVDHGADVISMSLGGDGTTQTLTDAVAYAASKGAVMVAAAGNSGSANPTHPAAYPQVIGVAGSTPEDELYSWSNYGPWVQVAAPGCNTAPQLGGGYINFCGTSSAAPLVSGLAALALSLRPGAGHAAVEAAIRGSGAVFSGASHGRVDAQNTLVALGAPAGSAAATPKVAPAPAASGGRSGGEAAAATMDENEDGPAPASGWQTTYRGAFAGRASRRFARFLPGGRLLAELTFAGARPVTLEVRSLDRRKTVARVSGQSPLQLTPKLQPGRYEFVVRGSSAKVKGRFALGIIAATNAAQSQP